jgi:hypothetical protein
MTYTLGSQVVNVNFWDVMTCSLVERDKHFVETCYIQHILQMQVAGSSEMVTRHLFVEYCNLIVTVHGRSPYILESHMILELL